MDMCDIMISKFPDKIIFGTIGRNVNSSPSEKTIEKYIDKPWNWYTISSNVNLSLRFIEKHCRRISFYALHNNVNLTLEFVDKYINKHWAFRDLSKHPCMTLEFVLKHPSKDWHYKYLKNPIPVHLIDQLKRYGKQIGRFDLNGLTREDWKYLSQDTHILQIESHPDWQWSWKEVSYNSSITADFVENHPDKQWNWKGLSRSLATRHARHIEFEKRYFKSLAAKLGQHLIKDVCQLIISYAYRHKDHSEIVI